ncbi:hypothetical protein TBR22_A46930 [Luteitalea sp. TBR-22]|uniref:DUF3347 domain-containing protein n=1 Tax=Luteitalea sp. TBR-22 TaxID=2802971 RepID=UPI001AF91511|nr:DUF3347 domain-containing protein [Luteitalea sp. TBR-22]BCS35466.1 hypothetical protein TBR22_A46930 [Luteitalea sp. TBR-22]
MRMPVVAAAVLAATLAFLPLGASAVDLIAEVVTPYLAIQEALVKDDLAPVAAAAASVQKGAEALGADGAAIVAAAIKAREARSLETARAAFGDLSTALIAFADRTRQPIEGKVVAFCPMVNKSWVQADGAVANPYYGKSMATCGSVQRKLSATR